MDSIVSDSVRLRGQSRQLISRAHSVMGELHRVSDGLVRLRADTNRLLEEARRLEELVRRLETNPSARRIFVESIRFADCGVFDDPELLIGVNSAQLECGKCGNAERLVAVVQFNSLEQILGLCGYCFRELSELSLGAVV